MTLDLYDEFQSLIGEMERAGIPYAVAGALALAVHGVPRATRDIDLLVRPEHVGQVMELARGLGFTLEAMPMCFPDGMEVRRLTKVAPGESLTLDLLLVNPNLEGVWASRRRVAAEPNGLWVVSRSALIAMKLAAGRPQDLADVERLRNDDR